jgi:hypothetical protein
MFQLRFLLTARYSFPIDSLLFENGDVLRRNSRCVVVYTADGSGQQRRVSAFGHRK